MELQLSRTCSAFRTNYVLTIHIRTAIVLLLVRCLEFTQTFRLEWCVALVLLGMD
jgi:hypothetical protein